MCETAVKAEIKTEKAPGAIGPYSQAVSAPCGTMIFISGQIPLDPASGAMVGDDAAGQARRALQNLSEVVRAAGAEMANVLKTTVYLKSMDDFAAVNQVYGEFFAEPYPARAAVEVARLPKDALVEIDAIVMK